MSRYELAIASQYRDESQYLREWIEYHKLVGFRHVYLLNHDLPGEERERSLAILAPYVQARFVTVVDHPATLDAHWQMIGWTHILETWGKETDWILLTDVDSFVFPVQHHHMDQVLPFYDVGHVAILSIHLCTFGDSGLLTPPALQIESFVHRAPIKHESHYSANYLFRPARMGPPSIKGYHVTKPGYTAIDTSFDVLPTGKGKRPGPLGVLRLNHYSIRSKQDWERKAKRGWYGEHEQAWKDPNHTLVDHKLRMLNHNEEFDDSMRKYVPALKHCMGLA